MSILCSCRAISDRQLKDRDDLPSFNGDWSKALKAVSGMDPVCGGCEEDLAGMPLSALNIKNNKETILGESKMPKIDTWSPPTSTPVLPFSYLANEKPDKGQKKAPVSAPDNSASLAPKP